MTFFPLIGWMPRRFRCVSSNFSLDNQKRLDRRTSKRGLYFRREFHVRIQIGSLVILRTATKLIVVAAGLVIVDSERSQGGLPPRGTRWGVKLYRPRDEKARRVRAVVTSAYIDASTRRSKARGME